MTVPEYMKEYYEKYSSDELLQNRAFNRAQTPEEEALQNRVYELDEYFSDMRFKAGTATSDFIAVKAKMENSDEWQDELMPLPDVLEYFSLGAFIFSVKDAEDIDGSLGRFEPLEYRLTVAKGCENRDDVVLHEMIHLYQAVIDSLASYHHDVVLWCLYNDLRGKISDLDERIKAHGHILNEHSISRIGGIHDILFLLKSFDLDLRMGYKLGTVFGYGMADE